jgi:hypothetical protein
MTRSTEFLCACVHACPEACVLVYFLRVPWAAMLVLEQYEDQLNSMMLHAYKLIITSNARKVDIFPLIRNKLT